MTRRKPAEQPHLAPLKTEGQPYHPDPAVMAKIAALDATDPLPQPDPATATEAMIYHKNDMAIEKRLQFAATGGADQFVWTTPQDVTSWAEENGVGTTDDRTTNPYLLESTAVLADLANEAHRARQTIAMLDAEMAHLTADADFQIQRITARRDAEVASRQARVDDLMKIVSANTIVNGEKQESGE